MGKSILKIYDDGEFWLDGKKCAKLYENGEIWADGKKIANVYEDGDIWMDGKKIGVCTSSGELWINNRKVADGIYLSSVLEGGKATAQQPEQPKVTYAAPVRRSNPNSPLKDLDGFGMILFCAGVLIAVVILIACFKLWITDMPEVLTGHLNSKGLKPVALVSVYAWMFALLYLHWEIGTRKNKMMFFLGLLLQGGAFLLNLLLFTVLDMCATASSYGIPITKALGELGKVTGFGSKGGFLGIVATVAIFGLAPTILGALINKLYLKIKGPRAGKSAPRWIGTFKKRPARSNASSSENRKMATPKRDVQAVSNTEFKETENTQKGFASFGDLFGNDGNGFVATRKVAAEKVDTQTKPRANMRIVNCPCGTTFRYPTDKGSVMVSCPCCEKQYRYFPK